MTADELGWPGMAALVCALITVIVFAFGGDHRWPLLMMTAPVQLIGIAGLAISVSLDKRWWLLALLPILLAPLVLWLMLVTCFGGACP